MRELFTRCYTLSAAGWHCNIKEKECKSLEIGHIMWHRVVNTVGEMAGFFKAFSPFSTLLVKSGL